MNGLTYVDLITGETATIVEMDFKNDMVCFLCDDGQHTWRVKDFLSKFNGILKTFGE